MSSDAFIDAVASALTTAGVVASGWPVHKRTAQDTPDQAIVIYETGGPEPEDATDRAWLRPTFQIMTRAGVNGEKAASEKAHAARAALHRGTVSGFTAFRATQSVPMFLGHDQAGRPRFVVNFRGGET